MRLRLGAFQACPWSPPDRLAVYSVSVCSSCVRFFLCCAFRSPIILLWHSVKRSKLCCDVPRYVCESFVLNLGHDSHVVCRLRNQCAETHALCSILPKTKHIVHFSCALTTRQRRWCLFATCFYVRWLPPASAHKPRPIVSNCSQSAFSSGVFLLLSSSVFVNTHIRPLSERLTSALPRPQVGLCS